MRSRLGPGSHNNIPHTAVPLSDSLSQMNVTRVDRGCCPRATELLPVAPCFRLPVHAGPVQPGDGLARGTDQAVHGAGPTRHRGYGHRHHKQQQRSGRGIQRATMQRGRHGTRPDSVQRDGIGYSWLDTKGRAQQGFMPKCLSESMLIGSQLAYTPRLALDADRLEACCAPYTLTHLWWVLRWAAW